MRILSFDGQSDVGYVAFSEGECCSSCGRQLKDGNRVRIRQTKSQTLVVCEPVCRPIENAALSEVDGQDRAAS